MRCAQVQHIPDLSHTQVRVMNCDQVRDTEKNVRATRCSVFTRCANEHSMMFFTLCPPSPRLPPSTTGSTCRDTRAYHHLQMHLCAPKNEDIVILPTFVCQDKVGHLAPDTLTRSLQSVLAPARSKSKLRLPALGCYFLGTSNNC